MNLLGPSKVDPIVVSVVWAPYFGTLGPWDIPRSEVGDHVAAFNIAFWKDPPRQARRASRFGGPYVKPSKDLSSS